MRPPDRMVGWWVVFSPIPNEARKAAIVQERRYHTHTHDIAMSARHGQNVGEVCVSVMMMDQCRGK